LRESKTGRILQRAATLGRNSPGVSYQTICLCKDSSRHIATGTEGGDLTAIEATLLNSTTELSLFSVAERKTGGRSSIWIEVRTFVEQLACIENCIEEVFRFKIHNCMKTRWVLRLTEKVLVYFPQAQELSDGKHKIQQGMQQQMVKWAMTWWWCTDGGVQQLAKDANIVRRHIVSHRSYQFDG
jgi:hypothetical protein